MTDINIIEHEDIDLSDAMLITAFPTVGLVSSIAGRFIVDSLDLKEVGVIDSDQFMPISVIHKSKISPPVRIYMGKKKCGPDNKCNQIALIISEFMPPLQSIKPLANKILEWAEEKKCENIVVLEGTRIKSDKKENMKVYGVGVNGKTQNLLKKYDIPATEEGMISGVNGVLLYQGKLKKYNVLCLLSEAHARFPDSRAAGHLLEKLDVMLPGIKIDPEPLYKEAEKIEKSIKKFMQQSKPTAPQMQQVSQPPMYG